MFSPSINARMYENAQLIKSKKIYNHLDSKSTETLIKYKNIIQPRGFINSIIALLDADRQLKINYLEDILSSRLEGVNKKKTPNESNSLNENYANNSWNDVKSINSDQDLQARNENKNKRKIHPYEYILTRILSRGYTRPQ